MARPDYAAIEEAVEKKTGIPANDVEVTDNGDWWVPGGADEIPGLPEGVMDTGRWSIKDGVITITQEQLK
jgi:hypothetical protein